MRRLLLSVLIGFLFLIGAASAYADYPAVEISNIPTFGQRKTYTIPTNINPRNIPVDVSVGGNYGDCGIDCVAMIEAYFKGYGSEDTQVYHAVMAARNPNVDWANVTYDPGDETTVQPYPLTGYFYQYGMSAEDIYAQIRSGNPVMVHRKYTSGGYEHWVVIYGYDGPSSYLDWTGFRIMSPTYATARVYYQRLNDLVSDWGALNCFMYRTSGLSNLPISEPSVSFYPWSKDGYTYIGETDAAIGQQIDVTGGTCTETGMYLYDQNGQYLAKASQSEYYYRIFFKINEELHYTLRKGTTYKYRFYAIMGGKTYWSNEYSFKTEGTPDVSVSFTGWSNDNYTYIGETDAAIGQEITYSGGTCTETGMYLYDQNGNYLAKASQGEYYYRIFFKINEELHYTLLSGTTYKYRFYAVVDGKTYWGDMGSFKTDGVAPTAVSVAFSPWSNDNYTYISATDAAIGQQIDVDGGTCTETGMYLYDYNSNYLAKASQNEYYYRIFFKINEECGYTLHPGILYRYKFYAVVGGVTYWSDMQSFRTGGTGFIITYDANNGRNAPQPQIVSGTQTPIAVTLTADIPDRDGYTFLGWSTNKTATTASYLPGQSYSASSDVTMYAVWAEESVAEINWENNHCFPSKRSAFISADMMASQIGVFSSIHLKIWDSAGNLVAEKEDASTDARQQLNLWYDVYSETGVSLKPNSAYTYQFSTLFNGREYESGIYRFTTQGINDKHFGIDVGVSQGNIDWDLTAQYIDFAIIRCGYGGNYVNHDDGQWLNNVAACERLGIPYGVYIYSYAENNEEALGEAEHVIRLLEGHYPSLPVYYDLEDAATVGNLTNAQIANQVAVFSNRIRKAGYKAGVYANVDWWSYRLTEVSVPDDCKWIAGWGGTFVDQSNMGAIWQFTSSGAVPGIDGRVDLNYSKDFSFGSITIPLSEHELIPYGMVLPASVETIEAEAFMNCGFESVKIPEGVLSVGSRAFANCESLKQVEIPDSVLEIGIDVFEGSNPVIICRPGSYAENYAIDNCLSYYFK